MNNSSPKALILGIDNFVARKLALALNNKDIKVTGLANGEGVEGLGFVPNYIFDFNGEIDVLEKFVDDDVKITVVSVNNEDKSEFIYKQLQGFEGNWRFVEAYGVYGPFNQEDNFLNRAVKQAVINENLVLPVISSTYRLLAVDDLIEAILRANFFAGTQRERFLIVGKEINSEKVASVLIDEAKMTKVRVIQNEINLDFWEDSQVFKNWQKLRWQPEIDFREGIRETLQYYFSIVDEENRNKNKTSKKIEEDVVIDQKIPKQKKLKNKKIYSVEIDEDEPESIVVKRDEPEPKKIKEDKIEEKVKEDVEEITEEEDEEKFDFKPIVIKKKDLEKIEEMAKVQSPVETEIKKKSKIIKWRLPVLLLIFLLMVSVPVNWILVGFKTVKSLDKVKNFIEEEKYSEAKKELAFRLKKVKAVNESIDNLGINNWLIGRRYQEILRVGEDGLRMGDNLVNLMEYSSRVTGYVMGGGEEINWEADIKKMRDELVELSGGVGVLSARMDGDWQWLPGKIKNKMDELDNWVDISKNMIEVMIETIDILPDFLGADGKRKDYLVLLQNEMELRAGGGFIGSFGILSFQNGRLTGFDIQDVYEVDGQLKGHVEPPEEIKKYLGEAGWFMRDANWQADFVGASKDIQWFLEKSVNRKVDGVIGIDLAVVKEIVGVLGQVKVPDFDEEINKDNLYEKAQFYAEAKFFPGSKRKASFLSSLGRQLFEEINYLSADERLLLGKNILDLLERNEIQIALNETDLAKKIASNGWDGSLFRGECADDRCVADYMFIVESNFGVNKANYFVYRNIEQTVDIQTNGIRRVVKINYENTAKTNGWPGGDYKNYMRIYLPVNAEVEKVEGIDLGEQLRINKRYGKQEVGFLTTVEVNSKKTVELVYFIRAKVDSYEKFSYLNYIQKQSGFGDTNLVTLVSYPNNWQPLQVEPVATMMGGNLLFNQKLDRDLKMGLEIGK